MAPRLPRAPNRKTPLFNLRRAGGYRRHPRVFSEVFNVTIASLLFILSLPLWLVTIFVIWIREGRPIFYSGMRLGKHKKPFRMYKFRTLVRDADRHLEGSLLGSRQELITSTGKFLRDTRLDELPQLINVIRRDMDLVGPRPVRPEVYEKICANIPHYDRRFTVHPGLIGFSQLFTPHSTPKALRTIIDNRLIQKQEKVLWNLGALSMTAWLMVCSITAALLRFAKQRLIDQLILGKFREKRRYERVRPKEVQAYIVDPEHPRDCSWVGQVVDINVEAFLLHSKQDLTERFPARTKLVVRARRLGTWTLKQKVAYCDGEIVKARQTADGSWQYVIKYEPTTPFNFYLFHQYLLQESVG